MTAESVMFAQDDDRAEHRSELDTTQFVLEYIHAVLSSFPSGTPGAFDEKTCAEIYKVADELRAATFRYCMYRSLGRSKTTYLSNSTMR